jgi:hypothetical protein
MASFRPSTSFMPIAAIIGVCASECSFTFCDTFSSHKAKILSELKTALSREELDKKAVATKAAAELAPQAAPVAPAN